MPRKGLWMCMGRKIGRPSIKADWEKIRWDYESGMPLLEVARKWRVKAPTISSRSTREEWSTPQRFKMAMAKATKMAQDVVVAGIMRSDDPDTPEGRAVRGLMPQLGSANVTDPLEYQRIVAEFAMRSVSRGLGTIQSPKNWRELATADTLARRAAGLDSKGGGGSAGALIRITSGAGVPTEVQVGVVSQSETGGHDFLDDDED